MSERDNQEIMEWVQVFINAGSPNDDIRKKAENTINQKRSNEPTSLIIICTIILSIDENKDINIIIAKSLASIILVQMLNFQKPAELEFKRKNLTPNMIEPIINSLKKNVFSSNPVIRNKCAQCYSILFAILTKNWPDGIQSVTSFFSNPNLSPTDFIGLVSIMDEIVIQNNFVDEIAHDFEVHFIQTLLFCIDILSKSVEEHLYVPELRICACKYILDLINNYSQILNDGENVGARVPILLTSISNSFQVSDLSLFNNLHELLFLIVKKFYQQTPVFMEIIARYVGNGFYIDHSYANICIYFWYNVACFEQNLIERYLNSKKTNQPYNGIIPLNPLLSATASSFLLPILVDFIEKIDEKNTSVDDVQQNPEPYMYSTMTIAALYRLNPPVIFEYLKDKINENMSKDKWTNIHAGIQMIYAIAGEPLSDNVGIFIAHHFETLLLATKPNQVPRLRETALFVISLIIKNYPKIITQAGEFTDKRINDIIDSIEPTLQLNDEEKNNISYDNRQIFIRYSNIISNLSYAWKANMYESHLDFYFDKFYLIYGSLFNFGIINGDHMLIRESGSALDCLIFNSTPKNLNKIDLLYSQTLEMLSKSKKFYCSQEIIFMIQSSLCSNIKTILLKLKNNPSKGKEIISQYVEQTLSILYDLLSNRNTFIYEEGLYAISALICATNTDDSYIELFTPNTFERLMNEFVFQALKSGNEGVINAACLLIGNLFRFLSGKIPTLNNYIHNIFNTLVGLIMNNKEMRSIHPFILRAIANIFNFTKEGDESILQLEVPFRDLLTKIYDVSHELDITNKNDTEYGNLVYQYLSDGFCGYAKVFYNKDNIEIEKKQLILLDNLAKFIYKLSPKISGDLYISFRKTALQFAQNCSRKNNAILNRNSIHRILKLAMENFPQRNIQDLFQHALCCLKSK